MSIYISGIHTHYIRERVDGIDFGTDFPLPRLIELEFLHLKLNRRHHHFVAKSIS